jgi:hypothetical protein
VYQCNAGRMGHPATRHDYMERKEL